MSGKYTELFLLLEKQHAIVIATQSDFTRQDVLDNAAGENIIVLYIYYIEYDCHCHSHLSSWLILLYMYMENIPIGA